jgi:hypothetical protein
MASGGGLLDLVARGKKDTFFNENPKISFIHSVYNRTCPTTQEIRYTHPKNKPAWGQMVEFDIERIGDIMRNPVLLIDLPTWLPVEQAKQNPTSFTCDISGIEYGYCKHIGVLMIDKVQVFAGQYLLQEFWGQWLEWRTQMDKKAPIYGSVAGVYTTICKSATPNQLRVHLPILGNQREGDKGFPSIALSGQSFTIRVFLKRLEDVVEASDSRINAEPWNKKMFQVTSLNSRPIEFKSLERPMIGSPTLTLETTQVYVSRDAQELLKRTQFDLPFTQVQQVKYTIEDSKWAPVNNLNTTVSIPVTLDFTGAVSRLIIGVQSEASLRSGQLYNLSPAPGLATQFLQTLRLNTGLRDRLNELDSNIWRDVSNYWKNERAPGESPNSALNIYTLTFGLEDDTNSPIGTFNMSRADTQVLYATLSPISADSRSKSRRAYIIIFAEAWNLYEIKDGKGKLKFAD